MVSMATWNLSYDQIEQLSFPGVRMSCVHLHGTGCKGLAKIPRKYKLVF